MYVHTYVCCVKDILVVSDSQEVALFKTHTQGHAEESSLSQSTPCPRLCARRLSALLPVVPSVCLTVDLSLLLSSAFWELWVQVCMSVYVCVSSVCGTGNKWKMAHGISMSCSIFSLSCCDRSDNERRLLPLACLSVLASGSWTPNDEAKDVERAQVEIRRQTHTHTHAHIERRRETDAGVLKLWEKY